MCMLEHVVGKYNKHIDNISVDDNKKHFPQTSFATEQDVQTNRVE